jgi:hypothetical protein
MISRGSISQEMREWLGQRGGWGQIELEVCEIIGSNASVAGASVDELNAALGNRHEPHTLQVII